jgi:hypothetical protein
LVVVGTNPELHKLSTLPLSYILAQLFPYISTISFPILSLYILKAKIGPRRQLPHPVPRHLPSADTCVHVPDSSCQPHPHTHLVFTFPKRRRPPLAMPREGCCPHMLDS